jgi:hypothetical protein
MYSSTLSLTSALGAVDGQRHPPATLPPGKTQYPLHKRVVGSQSRSARVRKISPPPGFDHRSVQSVASCYTDSSIPAHPFLVAWQIVSRRFKSWYAFLTVKYSFKLFLSTVVYWPPKKESVFVLRRSNMCCLPLFSENNLGARSASTLALPN